MPLPQFLKDQYSSREGKAQAPQTQSMPQGDTIQSMSLLPPQAHESTRRRTDPEVLRSFGTAYGMSREDAEAQAVFKTKQEHERVLAEAAQSPYLGVDHIRRMEGTKTDPNTGRYVQFPDPAGYPVIGYGHLLSKEELASKQVKIGNDLVHFGEGLTKDQVEALLQQDTSFHTRHAKQVVEEAGSDWEKLPKQMQIVAQDLTYQVGPQGFRKYKPLLAAMREGDWNKARQHVKRSYIDPSTGKRVPDTRRTRHAQALIDDLLRQVNNK